MLLQMAEDQVTQATESQLSLLKRIVTILWSLSQLQTVQRYYI